MSSVIDNATWQNIPHEIWLTIFTQLPVKSQVSLACTCKKLYEFSLDKLLGNVNQRAELYLEIKQPLPSLLARSIRVLRIDSSFRYNGERRHYKGFLKEQILRMTSLQRLILGDDRKASSKEHPEAVFSAEEVFPFFACENLEEFRVPVSYLGQKALLGRNLLHYAVETGRIKLVESFLSQFETYFYNSRDTLRSLAAPPGLGVKDRNGLTPLMLAFQRGDREMFSLLLRREARGVFYQLRDQEVEQNPLEKKSKVKEDLSLLVGENMLYGAHLHVKVLRSENEAAFFTALAENRTMMSIDFAQSFCEALEEKLEQRVLFLHNLAEALQKNTQILLLDLRNFGELTSEEGKLFFQCQGLEELLLPRPLLNCVDDAKQTLLHLAVLAQNKKIVASLALQGAALTQKDDKGYTPAHLARTLGANEMASFLEDAAKKKIAKIAFGKKDWEKYYGKIGKEPPLPFNILEILESPCPIWPGQKMLDTHFLVFIPQTVNGTCLNTGSLQDLIYSPKEGGYAAHVSISILGGDPSSCSQWVLFTKDVIPNTQVRNDEERKQALRDLAAKTPSIPGLGDYRIPMKTEAATCILTEYVRSGRRYYAGSTFCYCQEMNGSRHDGIGGFSSSIVFVHPGIVSYQSGHGMLREVGR